MAEQKPNKKDEKLAKLERRLGQLTYETAKLQQRLQQCQKESNEVATEIERLNG